MDSTGLPSWQSLSVHLLVSSCLAICYGNDQDPMLVVYPRMWHGHSTDLKNHLELVGHFQGFGAMVFQFPQKWQRPTFLSSSWFWCDWWNVYQVIEKHDSQETLLGAALKNGLILILLLQINKDKNVPSKPSDPQIQLYDEIVIPQEAQIVPAFILEIDVASCREVQKMGNQLQRTLTVLVDI